MTAIYKKEMRAYFHSIIGWLFIGFFVFFIGLFFFLANLVQGVPYFGYTISNISLIFVLMIPMLTMRIMAEENRQKTDQLLLTAPVSVEHIILGKYLAMLSVFGIVTAVACVCPLLMAKFGTVSFPLAYCSIGGFFLLGATYMAIGMFISSVTDSQAFAAILTFIVVLVTSLLDSFAGMLPTDAKTNWLILALFIILICVLLYTALKNATVAFALLFVGELALLLLYIFSSASFEGLIIKIAGWCSLMIPFNDMVAGVLDISALVYYFSLIALFVFLTVQTLKKRRWN